MIIRYHIGLRVYSLGISLGQLWIDYITAPSFSGHQNGTLILGTTHTTILGVPTLRVGVRGMLGFKKLRG